MNLFEAATGLVINMYIVVCHNCHVARYISEYIVVNWSKMVSIVWSLCLDRTDMFVVRFGSVCSFHCVMLFQIDNKILP